ncbi:TolC family protein [Massilia cavernae]|uniref:TolC family protein n=1 Tax=Massilia cavernae TaxID=2320864 RepID=A0A418Y4G3_9BURK|nr:TolC family protein [Massilia cavernae]RJG20645.1 TolC family protein [Massilia cavernae]
MPYIFAPLALALLLAHPALAAEPAAAPAPLTLDAALGLALQHNPVLTAATHEVHIAAGQRDQAAAIPNPEMSFLREGFEREGRTTTVMVNQVIELGGKRGARVAVAELDGAAASAELAAARGKVRAEVMTAFFDVLAAQERMKLAEASRELAQRATGAAARRVAAGRISPVEETRARVAEANSKIELNQAGSELEAARRQLAATWGSGAPSFGAVEASASTAPARPSAGELAGMLAQAPQLVLARLEVDRQQARADLERRRRVPDLTLSLGSKRDEQFGQRQAVVGVSLPIPLFDRNQGNMASALRRTDKARDELAALENRLALDVAQASLRLASAETELNIIRGEILPAAQSAHDVAVKGFELGKFSFLDVLDAQRTLFQARTQYVRSLAELHRAGADIERLLGRSAYKMPSAPTS